MLLKNKIVFLQNKVVNLFKKKLSIFNEILDPGYFHAIF